MGLGKALDHCISFSVTKMALERLHCKRLIIFRSHTCKGIISIYTCFIETSASLPAPTMQRNITSIRACKITPLTRFIIPYFRSSEKTQDLTFLHKAQKFLLLLSERNPSPLLSLPFIYLKIPASG